MYEILKSVKVYDGFDGVCAATYLVYKTKEFEDLIKELDRLSGKKNQDDPKLVLERLIRLSKGDVYRVDACTIHESPMHVYVKYVVREIEDK